VVMWFFEFFVVVQATSKHLNEIDNPCNEFDEITRNTKILVIYPRSTIFFQTAYTGLSVLMVVGVWDYYRLIVKADNKERPWQASKFAIPLFSRFKFRVMLEMAVCSLQPIPFLNVASNTATHQSEFQAVQVNSGILICLRLYWLLRVIRDRTTVYKKRRELFGRNSALQIETVPGDEVVGWSFSLRTVYHKHSPRTAFITCLFAVCFFALAFFVTEWAEAEQIKCKDGKPDSFGLYSAGYLAVITMSTVGYGDFSPKTPLGKLVAAACAVTGVLCAAIITTTSCDGWNYPLRSLTLWVGVSGKSTTSKSGPMLLSAFSITGAHGNATTTPTANTTACFSSVFVRCPSRRECEGRRRSRS